MPASDPAATDRPASPAPRRDSSDYVRSRWPLLPPHIREAIVTLVDAGLAVGTPNSVHEQESDDGR